MRRTHALAAIVALAALLRFAALGELPRGFHPDEASEAFEAWTIARTGQSSDGRRLTFPNHGIGRVEGTYTWLAAAPVALLGPSGVERAARLPSALAGVLAVLGAWRLARRLLGERGALVAALLVASEPLAVHFSRCALRATLEPALLAWGLALAIEGLEADPRAGNRASLRVLAGGALLGLGVLTYPPARVVLPVVAALLAAAVPAPRERLVMLLGPPLVALLAITPFALTRDGAMRFHEISVANAPGPHDGPGHGLVLDALRGYVLHFAPRTLFVGDFARGFWAEDVAPLLLVEVPFLITGFVVLARRRSRKDLLLLGLVLAAPLASAVTRPAPNLIRAIFLVPSLALVVAAGVEAALARGRRAFLVFGALWVASLAFAAHRYTTVFPEAPSAWRRWQGYPEKVAHLSGDVRLEDDLERALVDLYARDRSRVWEHGGRSRTRVRLAPK